MWTVGRARPGVLRGGARAGEGVGGAARRAHGGTGPAGAVPRRAARPGGTDGRGAVSGSPTPGRPDHTYRPSSLSTSATWSAVSGPYARAPAFSSTWATVRHPGIGTVFPLRAHR